MPRSTPSRVSTRRSPSIPARARQPRPVAPIAGAATLGAALVAGAVLSRPGARVCHLVYEFLEYYAGVFSLVALSITVMGGIAATDRTLLRPHHRVQLQAVHRAMAALAMSFLVIHIATKIMESHAHPVDVAVPFLATHRRAYVGLGTIAAYLMVISTWTGISRSRFAGSARAWTWRVLHAAAYVSWPVAITHGLESGRPAKTWVLVSYVLCLILVAAALTVRLTAGLSRRASGPRARTTREIRAARRSRDALAAADEWPSGPLPPMEPVHTGPPPEWEHPVSPAARHPAQDVPTPRYGHHVLGEAAPAGRYGRHGRQVDPIVVEAPGRRPDPLADTLSREVSDEEFLAFLRGTGAQ